MIIAIGCVLLTDESVKYQTLPAVHLRHVTSHVTSPSSTTTTVGHEVDIEGSCRIDERFLATCSAVCVKPHTCTPTQLNSTQSLFANNIKYRKRQQYNTKWQVAREA